DPAGKEEERSISYVEILSKVKKLEREAKRNAFEDLSCALARVKQEATGKVLEKMEQSQSLDEQEKVQAVDTMFQTLLDFEEERKRLAIDWIEGARRPFHADATGKLLAARIEAKVKASEKSPASKEKGESLLCRLEKLMHSINPEVLR
ncbi:MAG: hypothetical protein RBS57_14040, partial [Desulforhabdus sp.]|nr:hypothetical protein [Desulforhabdus sp.]